ncbi:MAG: outer membrane beta-barrel protein [Myxococcota bacterium]|nr:outer membrane beta-barrel protein [Myxococcota bacterium]
MRSIKTVALVAATLLLVPQLAAAADLDTEVQDMKQRLEQMETQLKAQDQELAAAKEDRSATSALSSFLEKTDISGFVAGGWRWTKDDNTNVDSNTFNVQQYWIEMNKAPTEESRAGFNIALQGGEFCTVGGCAAPNAANNGNSNTVHLYTANVSYLAPLGSGLTVTAGIMPTLIGYEVENQNGNFFISRSLLWAQQPVTSTGVQVGYNITDQLSLTVGAINAPITDVRFDDVTSKSITSLLAFSAEKFYLSAGLNWGKVLGSTVTNHAICTGQTCDSQGIFDLIATVNPIDKLMIGVNYDYHFSKGRNDTDGLSANGISVFSTFQIIDSTAIGVRYDWLGADAPDNLGGARVLEQWEITATVSHKITDGLTGKVEYRHDDLDTVPTPGVVGSTNSIWVQMMYEF